MKRSILCLLFLLLNFNVFCQSAANRTERHKPIDLLDAVSQLHFLHSDSLKQELSLMSEEEFTVEAHMNLGIWIRNNWKLWRNGKLSKYFNSLEIFHPDDMSGIILTCYYRDLKGLEWKLEEQLDFYKKYWQDHRKRSK